MTDLPDICSNDYFPSVLDNVTFYADRSFDNPNVEVGSVMVWKGDGYKNGKGWDGHVATVVGVTRDRTGKVLNIKNYPRIHRW